MIIGIHVKQIACMPMLFRYVDTRCIHGHRWAERMTYGQGRSGRPWRNMQAQVRAEESTCWLCGLYIDPCIAPRKPMSFSVDHVIPLAYAPELALMRNNLRAAHLKCNVTRSNRMRTEMHRLSTSRKW